MERESLIRKIAAFVYATAVLEQGDSSVHVYLKDIEKHFGRSFFPKNWKKDIELLKEIQWEILEYKGCDGNADTCWLDVKGYDEYGNPYGDDSDRDESDNAFNMCLFTDYIACDYDAEEDY